jgi:DNA-directed RNA polymerase subunit omega
MARITVEDCTHLIENRFALCILAVKRARQLKSGARPIVEATGDTPPVMALRDIASRKVRFDRDVRDVLSGKFNPPVVEKKLVPAGSRTAGVPPPSFRPF